MVGFPVLAGSGGSCLGQGRSTSQNGTGDRHVENKGLCKASVGNGFHFRHRVKNVQTTLLDHTTGPPKSNILSPSQISLRSSDWGIMEI